MSKPRKDISIQIPSDILKELLTSSEIRMLKNRWQIINLLREGFSIRKIATQLKVGTDTVVRIIRMIEKKDILGKKTKKINSSTPWIFGKSD